MLLQLSLEQAERDRHEAEEAYRRDANSSATSNSSALDRLQQQFEVKERKLKAEASQALQAAQRECKVKCHSSHSNLASYCQRLSVT